MRPKTFSLLPVTASLTGFLSNATGATWTLTNTATTDGMAHQVTIKNDSATDHSLKTATLVGTDADGMAITEVLALPAGTATTTSVKYYKTLTSIVPSATINADTMDIGWAAPSKGSTYVLDWPNVTGGGVSLSVVITGTINYSIEHTLDNVFNTQPSSCNWVTHSTVASETTSQDGNYAFPVMACRLAVTSVTNGATVGFTIIQGRN